MKIAAAISFPFRGPHAWANLGCLLVCMLIPVVGMMVMLGYCIKVECALLENPDADAPRFDFGKFTAYLTRGVQAFLVALVLALVMVPLVWLCMAAFIFMPPLIITKHVLAAVICLIVGLFLLLAFIVIFGVVTAPMTLKAGLEDRFAAAFDMNFVWGYLKRVGLLAAGTSLLLFFCMIPLMFLSCIPFVNYGVIAAITMINLHIRMQLYQVYLQRGGTPIAIKQDIPDPAFPVVMSPPPMPSI